ncbi:MAG TPA: cupredoxin domain-containing protein [Thermoanaerobaculia bacterium]|nr:cupredoxin domain-containing protein [Thermoanaerobaculia bacterium]
MSLRAFKLASPLAAAVAALAVLTGACDKGSPTEPKPTSTALPATATVPPTTMPTRTPTPSGTQTITIAAHAWDFNPGGPVSSPLVLTVGTTYRLVFHNVDGPLVENARHGFTGIPELGLPGTDSIARGGPDFVIDNVTLVPSQRGLYPYSCTNNNCGGDPQQHAGMLGLIIVQ